MIFIIIFLFSYIFAKDELGVIFSRSKLFDFASYLESKGDYYRAITEYKRFLYLYPDDRITSQVYFRIGRTFYLGGDYIHSRDIFLNFLSKYPNDAFYTKAIWFIGESYYNENNYIEAKNYFNSLIDFARNDNEREKGFFKLGLISFLQKDFNSARIYFKKTNLFSDRIYTDIDKGERLNYKSNFTAMFLSALFPGMGEIYAGKTKKGLITFLGNISMIGLTIYCFQKQEYLIGVYLGITEISWYSYNIIKASNAVEEYNKNIDRKFFDYIKIKYKIEL